MTKSRSKKPKAYKNSTKSISTRRVTPSPAFSISSNGSIKDFYENILEDPNNLPLDTRRKTMSNVVSSLKPYTVKQLYRQFKNDEKGGKKSKRITIKKKKARKTLKKPMFKRNK